MKCGGGEDATWLDERRLFVVRLIRTVSLDLCPEALLLVFESAMLLGTSCQHLRCIADAAAGECWSTDGDRHPMRYPPLLGPPVKRCRRVVSKKVVLWLCDLAEQTEEELAESDTTESASTFLDRIAKAIYQVLLQGPFLTSCLSSADGGMLLAVTKPLCRFLDHLVRLNRLENAHLTRIVRMSRCLHDKIDSILRVDGPPSHRATKLARDTMNLRFSLRTLANTVRKLKNTGGSTEVQNDEADHPTPSVDSLYPSQAPSSTDGRASAIRPFPAAKRSRLSHVPTPCTGGR
ncbi:hypothetical protein FOL46_001843 [Perkinsus olseni]|uniref:Uncharacterized protein n=1 Tax=Perkinsus olseni TaxID=32597 RepID=A0A7J6KQT6_PEROL|nr:hypothetical protein FOL46_001843 [Perkinsus olseni]